MAWCGGGEGVTGSCFFTFILLLVLMPFITFVIQIKCDLKYICRAFTSRLASSVSEAVVTDGSRRPADVLGPGECGSPQATAEQLHGKRCDVSTGCLSQEGTEKSTACFRQLHRIFSRTLHEEKEHLKTQHRYTGLTGSF